MTDPRFLSKAEVLEKVGVSYQTLHTWMCANKFPRSRELGDNRVGWLASEVNAWILSRPKRRLKGDPVPA